MRYLSLFSGIEACSVAWQPLGWTCVGVAEIEPFPCAVLAHHYPNVPNLGDVTAITDERIAALGPIDLVVGGSPCQDLSVAGKRAGLAGERSGLFHEQLRIFHAARHLCGARFLLWENVPGAFSSNGGGDFAVVVGAMAGTELAVPADGWGSEGVALGPSGLVEWSVLDAQWFNVAQRRERVFALLDAGDWSDRPPVLLEPDSLRGDSAPRREAGQTVARPIASGSAGSSGYRNDADTADNLIAAPHAAISPAIKARDSKGASSDGDGDGAILVPMVAHALTANGFNASEDGTGRGTPLVPVHAFDARQSDVIQYGDKSGPLDTCGFSIAVAFSCKDYGADAGDIAPTLRAMGHGDSHANAGGQVAVCFDTTQITSAANYSNPKPGDPCHPLTAGAHPPAIAFDIHGVPASEGASATDVHVPLRARPPGQSEASTTSVVMQAMQVRRLTPRECERLQGFPDDYTLIPMSKRNKAAEQAELNRYDDHAMQPRQKWSKDGPRYKALGNSMATPVMGWIGRSLMRALETT